MAGADMVTGTFMALAALMRRAGKGDCRVLGGSP